MDRILLELGGKNPLIVLKDADLDYAVNAASFGSFFHQGQICMSVERIFVEAPVAERFAARLAEKAKTLKVGEPRDTERRFLAALGMTGGARNDGRRSE